MCVRGISGLLDVVGHWPWETIAAFVAAGVALYVGQMQTSERRRLVGREVVAQCSAAVQSWSSAAFQLRHQHVPGSSNSVRLEYRQAAEELSRALLAVQMTCNDAGLALHRKGMVIAVSDFSTRAQAALSGSDDTLSEQDAAILEGLSSDLTTAAGDFLGRAMQVYAEPPRWRDRIPKWLRDEPRAPHDAEQLAR